MPFLVRHHWDVATIAKMCQHPTPVVVCVQDHYHVWLDRVQYFLCGTDKLTRLTHIISKPEVVDIVTNVRLSLVVTGNLGEYIMCHFRGTLSSIDIQEVKHM